jgi:Uma2 family endonuclease
MSTVRVPGSQRLVLPGIEWKTYKRLLRVLGERPALRLTYDRGVLEIMTTSPRHERYKHFIGRLIIVLTEELLLPIAGYGSMTFTRRRRQRGLEPDQCYWIAHEPQVRGKDRLDFRVDPPPDLVLEIDITRSSLNRMSIYAALGVPEVWRFDGQVLTFYALQPDETYAAQPTSLTFPTLTPGDLMPFLALQPQQDENTVIRQFRAWVRQRFPGGSRSPQP